MVARTSRREALDASVCVAAGFQAQAGTLKFTWVDDASGASSMRRT